MIWGNRRRYYYGKAKSYYHKPGDYIRFRKYRKKRYNKRRY